jgi:hypothetical protein
VSALLYDIIQKIEFEPANFEIFKTETVAKSVGQNLFSVGGLAMFCKFKSKTAFRLEIQFKVKSKIAKLAPTERSLHNTLLLTLGIYLGDSTLSICIIMKYYKLPHEI